MILRLFNKYFFWQLVITSTRHFNNWALFRCNFYFLDILTFGLSLKVTNYLILYNCNQLRGHTWGSSNPTPSNPLVAAARRALARLYCLRAASAPFSKAVDWPWTGAGAALNPGRETWVTVDQRSERVPVLVNLKFASWKMQLSIIY